MRSFLTKTTVLTLVTAAILVSQQPRKSGISHGASVRPFIVEPYLQLGATFGSEGAETMTIMWHAPDADANWTVKLTSPGRSWGVDEDRLSFRRIALPAVNPHRVYRAEVRGLTPGGQFDYEVLKNKRKVFGARAQAVKPADAAYRFAVFGDSGQNNPAQKAIAYEVYRQKPDFVFITGDIVYSTGRISEYRSKYFPIYNSEEAAPSLGAPLLRSTLFVAAPGNHDILTRDFRRFPDLLAYFYYWDQPLNGPAVKPGAPNTPTLAGPEENQAALMAAAASNYPRMANFSFDYGNAHWTVLDSNPYVDWTDPKFKHWLEADLHAARKATWRFVAFHHPGFNSSQAHFREQQTRVLAPVFEKGDVDIVFAGHVHNYQRSYPMRFRPKETEGGSTGTARLVAGSWDLDKEYDGEKHVKPKGVIYIVTGGGGARLYNPEQQDDRSTWQEFTCRYFATQNSFSLADVDGKKVTIRQLVADGGEADRFVVSK
jgi:3',5'-cyclic AMP phosphodiesterase CpdA